MTFEEILKFTSDYGVLCVLVFVLIFILYKLIEKVLKDAKSREEITSQTMTQITDTIKETSATNKSLAETNRLLVDKISYDLQEIKDFMNIKED